MFFYFVKCSRNFLKFLFIEILIFFFFFFLIRIAKVDENVRNLKNVKSRFLGDFKFSRNRPTALCHKF